MTMISGEREQVMESLNDKEYRDAFVSSSIDLGLAFQIRALREARNWSQSELGERAGMKQERISQLEDRNYGRPSSTTLKRLASAFDTAVIVKFASFSELVGWMVNLTPEKLAPASFEEEKVSGQKVERKMLEWQALTSTATHFSGTKIEEIGILWEPLVNPTDTASYLGTDIPVKQEPERRGEKPREFALAA